VDLIKRKAGDFRTIKGAKNLSKSYFLPRPLYKLPSCLFSVNTKLPDIPSTNKRVASCTKLQLKVQILVHSLSNPPMDEQLPPPNVKTMPYVCIRHAFQQSTKNVINLVLSNSQVTKGSRSINVIKTFVENLML
jgi:hypothetical protein